MNLTTEQFYSLSIPCRREYLAKKLLGDIPHTPIRLNILRGDYDAPKNSKGKKLVTEVTSVILKQLIKKNK